MHCDGYSQRIIWEDDGPRASMRRRGPAKRTLPKNAKERPNPLYWVTEPQIIEVGEFTSYGGIAASRGGLFEKMRDMSSKGNAETGSSKQITFDLKSAKQPQKPGVCVDDLLPSSPYHFLSPHPLRLNPLQSLFLNHYLNNFSLKYPTCLDPSNPFLSTLVPLALRNNTVLCAVLAIGGIQTGLGGQPDVKAEILALKGRTLRGCRELLQKADAPLCLVNDIYGTGRPARTDPDCSDSTLCGKSIKAEHGAGEDDLMLFASAMMLMVHDKLSGEPCSNLRPHLKFAHHFERRSTLHSLVSVHYKFLRNIFLYNDLLASISSGSPTLQDYGQDTANSFSTRTDNPEGLLNGDESYMFKLVGNRYYLPILLSRVANGSDWVTMVDIERWDGNMTWLPSFSSTQASEAIQTIETQPPSTVIADEFENILISEIYRNATRVFYFQRLRKHPRKSDEGSCDFQIQHFTSIILANLRLLPLGSAYESSLLFPIGIAAMEIRDPSDRAYVLSRLRLLEDRFQLNHFQKFREKLSSFWEDSGSGFSRQKFACDVILLG